MVNRSLSRIAGSILVLVTLLLTSCATAPSEPAPRLKPMSYSASPLMTIDISKQYTATIETGKGNMKLVLKDDGGWSLSPNQ